MVLFGIQDFGDMLPIKVVRVAMLIFPSYFCAFTCVFQVLACVVGLGTVFQGSTEHCVAVGLHGGKIVMKYR